MTILNNTYRHYHLFKAIGAKIPVFAHIPLIHGQEGKKLSKRHDALSVEAYRDLGYLPEALINYLARLGWSHDNGDIFSLKQAVQWFRLEKCGKSPARMDIKKLNFLNAHYIKTCEAQTLYTLLKTEIDGMDDEKKMLLKRGLNIFKMRATTLKDFPPLWAFILSPPILNETTKSIIDTDKAGEILKGVIAVLTNISNWTFSHIQAILESYIERNTLKFGDVAQPMRALLSGTSKSPTIFEMLEILGKKESIKRLSIILKK